VIILRPYQQQAVTKLFAILQTHNVAYLRGEVRCGKTLTVIAVAGQLNCQRVLIVTKKKAIPSIEADIKAMNMQNAVAVTNYEQIHKRAGESFDLLIVDEAHGAGAYPKPSKRFRDLQQLKFAKLLLMSGTPSPESFSQLYHQLNLSRYSPWAQFNSFYAWAKAGYVTVRQKYVGTAMPVNDYSDANQKRILADMEHLTVQMTQSEAGFAQPIVEQVHMVFMRPRTYRLTKRIMRDGVIGNPDCRSVLADTGAKVMSKLRQLWSGTVITEAHGSVITDDSKAQYIVRQWLGKSKVAILYTFDAERRMLEKVLRRAGIATVNTPEAFNTGDRETWFVGQVQASREGVNLSSADDLIFFGIDYAALSYLQGRDRASYLGRDRENRVHWLLASGGVEPEILETVRMKHDFTIAHYRNSRVKVSAQIDHILGERGVDGATATEDQPRRNPRFTADAPGAPAVVRGGEVRGWPCQPSPSLPPCTTQEGRVSSDSDLSGLVAAEIGVEW
jgi:SNF2 family DNA or RNA helicase